VGRKETASFSSCRVIWGKRKGRGEDSRCIKVFGVTQAPTEKKKNSWEGVGGRLFGLSLLTGFRGKGAEVSSAFKPLFSRVVGMDGGFYIEKQGGKREM